MCVCVEGAALIYARHLRGNSRIILGPVLASTLFEVGFLIVCHCIYHISFLVSVLRFFRPRLPCCVGVHITGTHYYV